MRGLGVFYIPYLHTGLSRYLCVETGSLAVVPVWLIDSTGTRLLLEIHSPCGDIEKVPSVRGLGVFHIPYLHTGLSRYLCVETVSLALVLFW